jgi:hypothetical protein
MRLAQVDTLWGETRKFVHYQHPGPNPFPIHGVIDSAVEKVELREAIDRCAHGCLGGHALPVVAPVDTSTLRSIPLRILRMRVIVVSVTK